MKKILTFALMLLFIVPIGFLFAGCGDDGNVLVTGVDFDGEELYLNVSSNEEVTLPYKVYPNNATNKSVAFSSSNESIASVNKDGKVTLKNSGEALITVRTMDGGYTDSIKVISLKDPKSISFYNSEDINETINIVDGNYISHVSVGEVKKLPIYFYNSEGKEDSTITNRDVKFTCDWNGNGAGISIINESTGVFKGVESGSVSGEIQDYVTLTATLVSDSEISASIRIYVTESVDKNSFYVSEFQGNRILSGDTITLNTDESDGLIYKAYLLDYASYSVDFDIYFNISDKNLFDVEMLSSVEVSSLVGTNIDNNILDNLKYFRIIPKTIEGEGSLHINISRSDSEGGEINLELNVIVQGSFDNAKIFVNNAKKVVVNGTQYDAFLVGDSFSFDIKYYSDGDKELRNISRPMRFTLPYEYINGYDLRNGYYYENFFQVANSHSDIVTIIIQINKNNDQLYLNSNVIQIEYSFYIIRNVDDAYISDLTTNPAPITEIHLQNGESKDLYVYTDALNGDTKSFVETVYEINGPNDIISITPYNPGVSDNYAKKITINTTNKGVVEVVFNISGSNTIEYRIIIYVI